ncbi:hypothetical protein OIE13_22150 [Streptosporangium sp. NBC_01810]|uniref:hypothetical protein n=1 Tax=Streptosporangium sp. NBC_01810 TaxID=2975951 RepID=UPI002DD8E50C|nr:hypothetical protein [Streptosporangium sp. NBC_01810]WSA23645.1 hypothetical protein OIE13_22150 [Streptosporangium sp. NBC_01810]
MSENNAEALADALAEALAAQQELVAFTSSHRRPTSDEMLAWMREHSDLMRQPEERP